MKGCSSLRPPQRAPMHEEYADQWETLRRVAAGSRVLAYEVPAASPL